MAVSNDRTLDLDRDSLIAWYLRNRERSRRLFDLIDPDVYYSRPIALRNPIVFYEGHLPAFSIISLINRGLGRPGIDGHRLFLGRRRQSLPAPAGQLAALEIDEPETGGPCQPAARVRRDAVTRPMVRGGQEGFLDGVLGRIEVPGSAGQRAKDLRRELAQQVLDIGRDVQRRPPTCCRYVSISPTFDGDWSITCRTWIGCCVDTPPGPGTAEIFAAISMARASDSTSTIW